MRSIELVVKAFQRQETQFSPPATRAEVAYNLLDGVNRLAVGTIILSMVLQPFSSFAKHGLHSPSTPMGSRRQPRKQKADSLGGEGGLKSLLWVPAGRGERQIIHSTSPEMSNRDRACTGLATHSQVIINTAGLRNDYTFGCGRGLQAQEIRLGSRPFSS